MNPRFAPCVIALAVPLPLAESALAQTINCDQDPSRFTCQIVDSTPSGNHLLVQETRLSDGSITFFIKSNIFNRADEMFHSTTTMGRSRMTFSLGVRRSTKARRRASLYSAEIQRWASA